MNWTPDFSSNDWSATANPAVNYSYDALGRMLGRAQPDNSVASWSYNGWDTTTIDENSHKKLHRGDALGRMVKVQEFSGANPYTLYSTTSYAYDVVGQLVSLYDTTNHDSNGNWLGGGNATAIYYDKLGRKSDLYDPDLGHWHYDYYNIGTLKQQTDAKAQIVYFEYDNLKRPIRRRRDGSSGTVLAEDTYDELAGGFAGYAGKVRRTTMKWGSGLANYVKSYFDKRGRVVKTDYAIEGQNYTISGTYDAADRPLSITLPLSPNNDVLQYGYGAHGLPISLTSSLRGPIVLDATYNGLGKMTSLKLANGLVTSYEYWGVEYRPGGNPNGHYGLLRSAITGALQGHTYDYYVNGNVYTLQDTRNQNETITFGYDHLDRLTSASSNQFSESYAYNPIGTFQSRAGVGYTYPSAGSARPHAPTNVGGNTYSYDSNGNLTSAEGRGYEYDVENRLMRVTESGSQIKGASYDGDAVLRTLAESGAITRRYVSPELEVDANGMGIVHFFFAGRCVAWYDTALHYLLSDHLSSTDAEAATTQQEQSQRRYLPALRRRSVGNWRNRPWHRSTVHWPAAGGRR